ncbi:hypothetical protein [Acinetobacter baumannii]|uniref:hypothetical protein n=1 Tax=Acinetobacter baumannii TaxID=470 RepID=UPI00244C7AA6|nr:hypothetical protein [Acinetobacter baumannii]MDH2522850.1 hypothetical protein [Acinetobacter baumannii]
MNKLFFWILIIPLLSHINFTSAKIASSLSSTRIINFKGAVIESTKIIPDNEEKNNYDLNNKKSYKIIQIYKGSFEYPTQKNADVFLEKVNNIIKTTPNLSIHKINDHAITLIINYE